MTVPLMPLLLLLPRLLQLRRQRLVLPLEKVLAQMPVPHLTLIDARTPAGGDIEGAQLLWGHCVWGGAWRQPRGRGSRDRAWHQGGPGTMRGYSRS